MSRKLTALKKELTQLQKATGSDDKGTPDNFDELSCAVAAGSTNNRPEQEVFGSYSFKELQWSFGKNTSNWPLWARQKFGV